MRNLFIIPILFFLSVGHAVPVKLPIRSMFGAGAYGKTLTITPKYPVLTDGTNIYVGTFTNVSGSIMDPVVDLQPNYYTLTFSTTVQPVHFTVTNAPIVLNLLDLITSGPVSVYPFPALYALPIATPTMLGGIIPDNVTIVVDPISGIATVVGGGGPNTNALSQTQTKQLNNAVTVTVDSSMTATPTVSDINQTNWLLSVMTNQFDLSSTAANFYNLVIGGTAPINLAASFGLPYASLTGSPTLGTSSVLSSNAFQFATNFFSRNTKFVDAGFGSDANDGSANYPWATVIHAQTNTPSGWTVAIAPGTYSSTVTNGQLNYYLQTGSTIGNFSFLPCTNSITGNGSIISLTAVSNSIISVTANNIQMGFDGRSNSWSIYCNNFYNSALGLFSSYAVFATGNITNNWIAGFNLTNGPSIFMTALGKIFITPSLPSFAVNWNTNSLLVAPVVSFTTTAAITNIVRIASDNITGFSSVVVSNTLGKLILYRDPILDATPANATATNIVGMYQTP